MRSQFLTCFFAYDLFLFTKASSEQIKVIRRCLNNVFCTNSVEKANKEKKRIFCSKNIHVNIPSRLIELSSFYLTLDLIKYPEDPLHHQRVVKYSYHFMVEKITLMTRLVLSSTCDKNDKMSRDFIWGSIVEGKGHLILWDKFCQPKLTGGLSIPKAKDLNKALLRKIAWGLDKRYVALESLC